MTGILDPDPRLELLGVVVGHLVRRDVRVHLQRAHPDVARARARDDHGQGERRGCGGGDHHGRLEAEPAAEQRRREAGGEHRAGGRADGGRAGHGRGRRYRAARTGWYGQPPCALGCARLRDRRWPCELRRSQGGADAIARAAARVARLPLATRSSVALRAARGPARLRPRTTARRASAGRPPGATARPAPSARRAPRSPRRGRPARSSPKRRRPRPTRPPPGGGGTSSRAASRHTPARPATRAPAARRGRRCRTSPARGGGRCGRRRRAGAGSASRRSATFISCMPRQIPSTGRSRSSARSDRAISARSRSGRVLAVFGWRAVAVGARVDVGAAGQHQPVEAVQHVVRVLGDPRVRREHQRDRARPLQRVDVGPREQERLAIPDRPARTLERGAEADPRSAAIAPSTSALPGFTTRSHVGSLAMSVQVQRRGAVATISLDRPEAMNAVNAELGDELLEAVRGRRRRRRRPRRRADRRRAARSAPAPTCARASTPAEDGIPTSARRCSERFHPIIEAHADDAQAGDRRRQRPRGRHRAARSRSPATWSSPPSQPTSCSRS